MILFPSSYMNVSYVFPGLTCCEQIAGNYETIILGDFNDYDGDLPSRTFYQPTSRVLQFLKNISSDYQLANVGLRDPDVSSRFSC